MPQTPSKPPNRPRASHENPDPERARRDRRRWQTHRRRRRRTSRPEKPPSTNAWPATPSAKAPRQGRPQLNGLDGRKSGTAPDYSYSDANKNSGITWNEAQFKEYIRDPKAKIPNTKMSSPASRTKKKSTICGRSSRNTTRTARSSSARVGTMAATDRTAVDSWPRLSPMSNLAPSGRAMLSRVNYLAPNSGPPRPNSAEARG